MSPLARSLLALTALLAAADAVFDVIDLAGPPGSLCTGFKAMEYNDTQFGVTTVTTEFQVHTTEKMHQIKDNCRPLNLAIASQTVKACNGFHLPDAPHWFPPTLHPSPSFSPIYAACESEQCLPIVFEITQKCITPPKNRRYGK